MKNSATITSGVLWMPRLNGARRWLHIADQTVFKVTIDYIVRNFSPTGIDYPGVIDSLYQVLLKPMLATFIKNTRAIIYYYREAALSPLGPVLTKRAAQYYSLLLILLVLGSIHLRIPN